MCVCVGVCSCVIDDCGLLIPRLCSVKKQKMPTKDVLGCRTLAEGVIQCIFVYGVGSPMVGLIPNPWLGG